MKAVRETKWGASGGYVKGIVAAVAPVKMAVSGDRNAGLYRIHDGPLVSSCLVFSRHTL